MDGIQYIQYFNCQEKELVLSAGRNRHQSLTFALTFTVLLLLLLLSLVIIIIFLFFQEVDKTPDELVKHQTNISELKRTFLEGGTNKSGLTEWEKRLSSSPLRSPRLDEAPMIEPLVPEDVSKVLTQSLSQYSDRCSIFLL